MKVLDLGASAFMSGKIVRNFTFQRAALTGPLYCYRRIDADRAYIYIERRSNPSDAQTSHLITPRRTVSWEPTWQLITTLKEL